MTGHPTDAELRGFAAGTLAADDLLRVDDHLAGCEDCRRRATALTAAATEAGALMAELSSSTLHLSDEDVDQYVRRILPPAEAARVREHLADCDTCAAQVDNLTAWAVASRRLRWSPLAIAAALLIGVLVPAMFWQWARPRPTTPPSLAGLETLPLADQARVQGALDAGVALVPDFMSDITAAHEVLMGPAGGEQTTLACLSPLGTGVIADRPEFEWRPLAGTDSYVVSVFDERSNLVTRSPAMSGTRWTPVDALQRGRSYAWQVTAARGSHAVTAPAAPAPPARFHVIDAQSADLLQRTAAEHPQAHLLLGLLYAGAGIPDAAEVQLRQVPPTDEHAGVARRSLERVQALQSGAELH